jgi:hypothetical protein
MNEVVLRESAVLAKPLKIYTVEYSSNNSGGSWWLSDEDWKALEKAGWNVHWEKDNNPIGGTDKDGRWLGALATGADIKVNTYDMSDAFKQAVESWRTATGQNPGAEGCNCCGSPHSFSGETGEHGELGYESSYLDSSLFRQVSYSDPW